MRAVKGKNGVLGILCRDETTLFNKADFTGFLDISTLSERDHYIAEEMHKKNILRKTKRSDKVGYEIYPQKDRL